MTDKLRQAAQQALGAVEAVLEFRKTGNGRPPEQTCMGVPEALRDALAEQAEQEPVAWSVLDKRTGKHWYTHESRFTSQHYANEYSHREPDGSQSMCVTPLYTAPQPRKPLTDEEIDECYEVARKSFQRSQSQVRGQQITPSDGFDWHFARAVIAAYEAKNGIGGQV